MRGVSLRSRGVSGPAVTGAAELPCRASRALLMKAAALLLPAPGGGRCHLLLVRALASLMRGRVSGAGPVSLAGAINLGQAFPAGPGLVCARRAGFVPRPGSGCAAVPRAPWEGGSSQPSPPALPPWLHPRSGLWGCCCCRVRDFSSCRWSSRASWKLRLSRRGRRSLAPPNSPPKPDPIPLHPRVNGPARHSSWDGESTEPTPIHRKFRWKKILGSRCSGNLG